MNKFYFLILVLTTNFLSALQVPKEVLEEFPALAHTFVVRDDGKCEPAQSTAVLKINASALQLVLPAPVAKRKFSCIYPACTSVVEYVPHAHNNSTFIALENFVEHVKSHAADAVQPERDPRVFVCRNVGCRFGSRLKLFFERHQLDCQFKSDAQRIDDSQAIKCPKCAIIFKSSCGLMTHMRHNPDCISKYYCDYALQGCSYESLYSSNYHRHVRICKFKPKAS